MTTTTVHSSHPCNPRHPSSSSLSSMSMSMTMTLMTVKVMMKTMSTSMMMMMIMVTSNIPVSHVDDDCNVALDGGSADSFVVSVS